MGKDYTIYEMSVIMERMHAMNSWTEAKDYGTGEGFYSVEVHILNSIVETPGISGTELAQEWNRTKGAISQILKKLEDKGMIYRKRGIEDKRKVFLYATEAGERLNQAHVDSDVRSYKKFLEELTKYYTMERICETFEVLEKWNELSKEWNAVWQDI